jgi:hypothetical protein
MGSNRQQAGRGVRDCGRNNTSLSRLQYSAWDSADEMRSIALHIHPPFMSLNAD